MRRKWQIVVIVWGKKGHRPDSLQAKSRHWSEKRADRRVEKLRAKTNDEPGTTTEYHVLQRR